MTICTCSIHCVESGYHEVACCREPKCLCWCHKPAQESGQDPTRYAERRKLGAGWLPKP